MCDDMTCPLLNFNDSSSAFWEWISNFITFCHGCHHLSMLGLMVISVCKRSPTWRIMMIRIKHMWVEGPVSISKAKHFQNEIHETIIFYAMGSWMCKYLMDYEDYCKLSRIKYDVNRLVYHGSDFFRHKNVWYGYLFHISIAFIHYLLYNYVCYFPNGVGPISGNSLFHLLRPSDAFMRLTIIGSDNGLSPGRRLAIF